MKCSSFEGGRPRPELSPCASPNKWRSADDPHIRTASLVQLTTLEGGCLGGGRNPLAVASLWRVYAERSRVQMVVWWICQQLRKPEVLSDHRGGLLLNYWWQRTLFCRGVRQAFWGCARIIMGFPSNKPFGRIQRAKTRLTQTSWVRSRRVGSCDVLTCPSAGRV